MARGYWSRGGWGYYEGEGPKVKFWCQPCDHVCKAPNGYQPHCPFCREPMRCMGHQWRPGKKGNRQETPVRDRSWAWWYNTGPDGFRRRMMSDDWKRKPAKP